MSRSDYKGIRIGNYIIRPLGIAAIVLLLLIIAGVVVLIVNPFSPAEDGSVISVGQPDPVVEEVVTEATPIATVAPTPTPKPEPRSATIRSLGEIAIQSNLLAAAKQSDGSYDFAPMFEDIAHIIGDADYTVANVEGTMGGTTKYSGGSNMITPPSIITALKDCGVDMFNLANDHSMDAKYEDLKAAMDNIADAGLDYVGAARSQAEKDAGKIIDINGIKVGFLGYTESLNGKEKTASKAAVAYGINRITKNTSPANDVKALRNAGAEVIITYMSWGEMLNRNATNNQKVFAKALVQAGVDVIIGYNPHVIQPAMWLEVGEKKTLCLFSAGNFLSDNRKQYSDSGVIFQFTIKEKSDYSGFTITNPTYIPTYVWRSGSKGNYDYRTLAVGEWVDAQPEGMNYSQYTRLKTVWAEAQSILGTKVAKVASK